MGAGPPLPPPSYAPRREIFPRGLRREAIRIGPDEDADESFFAAFNGGIDQRIRTTEETDAGSIRGALARMAWVKIPPENRPIFLAALPKDPRVETIKMFGGIAASE
jgi:hypothetical protein